MQHSKNQIYGDTLLLNLYAKRI